MDVYLEFGPAVKRKHAFSNDQVKELKTRLLRAISMYLCELGAPRRLAKTQLFRFVRRLRKGDVVISFNWDLTTEQALWEQKRLSLLSYTLRSDAITLLKLHGSADWFDTKEIKLNPKFTFPLVDTRGSIRVFKYFRYPKVVRPIVPVIIPPVYKKELRYREFRLMWRQAWVALREARELYIIGFSLPPEDLHMRFVMRSALRVNRMERAGRLRVALVNPDRAIFLRFSRLFESPIRYFECAFEDVSLGQMLSGGSPEKHDG